MAQVCGGSTYDYYWHLKRESALAFLRRVAGDYAARRISHLPRTNVLGTVLLFLATLQNPAMPVRKWNYSSRSTPNVLSLMQPKFLPTTIAQTAEAIEKLFEDASKTWEETGYPEAPSTDKVLYDLIAFLFQSRFVPHPPNEGPPSFSRPPGPPMLKQPTNPHYLAQPREKL
ncbi:MAG TPA: hypothetical protein VM008_12450 [Phycisphaerae bacterium]|nr:hypothetical protein [Phycisphaerae bacterium]